MLKWRIVAALGIAFGVAGVGWGYAQQQKPKVQGFYELRIYRNVGTAKNPKFGDFEWFKASDALGTIPEG